MQASPASEKALAAQAEIRCGVRDRDDVTRSNVLLCVDAHHHLPAHVMRAAKIRAAEHGESLKRLFTRAIEHELAGRTGSSGGKRVALPLIGRDEEPRRTVTNVDIDAALAEDDAEGYGGR